MCDTLVALSNSTKDGSVIFGKNSDRPFDEVQLISHVPRTKHKKYVDVNCTYISIPQVPTTASIILSQPWWMWGAEMGANEYGVVIGNEAVYSRELLKEKGLLGMDLLRLGLERGKSARESLDVIVDLLEKYGQGGGCAYNDPGWMYHNSYIIADPKEAYVLETADEWWIVEKVEDVRSISNNLSIRGKGDFRKKGIIDHAINKGYCRDDQDFDFAASFSESLISSIPSPYSREGKSNILLKEGIGKISQRLMMDFLREHEAGICMHGGFESTGSQVSHLRNEKKSVHWFTGTTLPCVSNYKPYTFPLEGQKYYNSGPYTLINPEWFWCKHQKFKPINRKIELQNIENASILEVTDLMNQEDEISEEAFIEKMKLINLKAWNKSLEMTN